MSTYDAILEEELAAAKARAESRVRRQQQALKILEDDAALEEWARQSGHKNLPVVRAEIYGPDRLPERQEMYRVSGIENVFGSWSAYPRRPVLMRGAKWVLVDKYAETDRGTSNGWLYRVVERYFRRIKYTCSDEEEHKNSEVMEKIWAFIDRRKYHPWRNFRLEGRDAPERLFVGDRYGDGTRIGAWVNGIHVITEKRFPFKWDAEVTEFTCMSLKLNKGPIDNLAKLLKSARLNGDGPAFREEQHAPGRVRRVYKWGNVENWLSSMGLFVICGTINGVRQYSDRYVPPAPPPVPYVPRVRKPDERAILQAVYELGLIQQGDEL